MKLIVFFLGILLLSIQVDSYNFNLAEMSIVLEVEENTTNVEEFTSIEDDSKITTSKTPYYLKISRPYLLSFDQVHPDQDLDPPENLS